MSLSNSILTRADVSESVLRVACLQLGRSFSSELLSFSCTEVAQLYEEKSLDGFDTLKFLFQLEQILGARIRSRQLPLLGRQRFFFWSQHGPVQFADWCSEVADIIYDDLSIERRGADFKASL